MGWFDEHSQSYDQVYNQDQPDHEGKFSHELLAGGAAFGAVKIWEDRQRAEGKPVEHQFAKEAIAGLVGAEVDKLVETKGLDYIDRERVKREARQRAEDGYDQHFGNQGNQYDPNQTDAQFQNY